MFRPIVILQAEKFADRLKHLEESNFDQINMKHNGKNEKIESAIQSHKKENPTHIVDALVIEIIDKADNNFKLMLKEMLHINKLKRMLNTQHTAAYKNRNSKEMFISQLNTIIIARKV